MVSTIRFFTFLLAVLASLPFAMHAQKPDPFFAGTDFAKWAGQPPVEQIPWKLRIISGGLSVYQRIVGHCIIDIPGRYFKQRSESGELVAMIEVTDSAGHIYQDHSVEFVQSKNLDAKSGVRFVWHAFVLPGDYEVILALYDRATGKHSFGYRKLRIDPLPKDPLPDAWSGLPTVELLKITSQQPDSSFHPEISGRLNLTLAPRRPVRIELLANLTGTGRAMVSHGAYTFNLGSLLPILKTFSQVEVRGGTLNVEVLDLVRRQVAFQQEDARQLDWPLLKTAVTEADPTKVDVRALQDIKHTAASLRQEVAQRIANGAGPPDALPVLILVSSSAFFEDLKDINDTLVPSECNCVVYYIRYNPFVLRYHLALDDFDNVKKVLRPLPVRARIAQSAEDLRRILAEIMDEVSKL